MAKNKPIKFPSKGMKENDLFAQIKTMRKDDLQWHLGRSFCLIYYPGQEYYDIVRKAYNQFFTENALNPTSFPSLKRMEAETVRMVADLLNGSEDTIGSMTSGGTESILMAVKTARDWAKAEKNIDKPEILFPVTAHPAFNKAFHYFGIKGIPYDVDKNFKADVTSLKDKLSRNTIMVVCSAPSYPHGVIDPVTEIASIAESNDILCHVDACIGGMVLPFVEQLRDGIPPFDFRVSGVTSMSADLHKYGYAAKGASVVLYSNRDLRKYQFSVYTSWPGGIYGSPAVAGSKPGGSIAAAWTALNAIGNDGYLKLMKKTLKAADKLSEFIRNHPDLELMGEPSNSIVALRSDKFNVYELADELNLKGWHFERLQSPPGLHFTVTQQHVLVIDEFLKDLETGLAKVKKFKLSHVTSSVKVEAIKRLIKILPEGVLAKLQKQFTGGSSAATADRTAPMYGMMGALQGTGDLDEIILDLLDKLNDIE